MASTNEPLFRARRLQLPLCQRRRASEELFVVADSRRGLSARTRLRSIEHFDPCRRRRFRAARRPDSRGGVFSTYTRTGHPYRADFETFGRRIGVLPKKMTVILDIFSQEQTEVYALTDRSFLDEKSSGCTNGRIRRD